MRFTLAHLFEALAQAPCFLRRQHVIRIDHALRLDEHVLGMFRKRYKISFPEMQGFEHLTGDYHLAPLTTRPTRS